MVARRARRRCLAERRRSAGLSQEALAERLGVERSTVARWEAGETEPQPLFRPEIAKLLGVSADELDTLLDNPAPVGLPEDDRAANKPLKISGGKGIDRAAREAAEVATRNHGSTVRRPADRKMEADEQAALELARYAAASDVGAETVSWLEATVDDLAMAYPVTPPGELLGHIRSYLWYVARFLDGRKTLREHRRLLVVGGWLSLLGATVHVDLRQQAAATARLRTATSLAREAEHAEIHGWCLETEAWRGLTDGNYRLAVELSQAAQQRAPMGSSAAIQAAAQEGRAWARLGNAQETYAAVERVGKLVAPMPRPDRPEHHYRYDPDKYTAYTATTLAWLGDPAAEGYAREIIARLKGAEDAGKWPRRAAAANLDLALALLVNDRHDEASEATKTAILSGRVVPSNHWRALELVRAVEERDLPEAKELREAYETMRREEQQGPTVRT